MTQHDPKITLRQMIDFAYGLERITAEHTRSELDNSMERQWALARGVEIFGESARRIPRSPCDQYPDVP
jgi:uncharacterized protein with HEPN domain